MLIILRFCEIKALTKEFDFKYLKDTKKYLNQNQIKETNERELIFVKVVNVKVDVIKLIGILTITRYSQEKKIKVSIRTLK